MIFLSTDLHGDYSPLREFAKSEIGKRLGKLDFVIVLGDFGIGKSTIEEIWGLDCELPFTLMFLDGNHEEFPLLESMEKKKMYGGAVHDINGVYHLCRGEVFELPTEDKKVKIAVCGGGNSRDRERRILGQTWFLEEEITDGDVENLRSNLEKYNFEVDYFLSHVMSSAVKTEIFTKSITFGRSGSEAMIPRSCEYKIRDMIGFTKAKKYISGHEHISMRHQLCGKEYVSIYGEFYLLEK